MNTCILGRMYFTECSIHFIEEHWLYLHRSSGFRSNHRLLRQCCFVWSEIKGHTHQVASRIDYLSLSYICTTVQHGKLAYDDVGKTSSIWAVSGRDVGCCRMMLEKRMGSNTMSSLNSYRVDIKDLLMTTRMMPMTVDVGYYIGNIEWYWTNIFGPKKRPLLHHSASVWLWTWTTLSRLLWLGSCTPYLAFPVTPTKVHHLEPDEFEERTYLSYFSSKISSP